MSSQVWMPARVNPILRHSAERRISLDGPWRFRLDPGSHGLRERWFEQPEILKDEITVPGCWQGQGQGHDGDEEVWDFRLKARVFRATYSGDGWYCREVALPPEWQGSRVWLSFGGVHPSAEVWLNRAFLGENGLPFVPFGFEVTDRVSFERPNSLIVRVHEKNRPFGLAFNWQGNWSGLYRGVELTSTGPACLDWCGLYADAQAEALRLTVKLANAAVPFPALSLHVTCKPWRAEGAAWNAVLPLAGAAAEWTLPVPAPRLWSPDSPSLYQVDVALAHGPEVLDARSERVGFVKLSTQGKHFLINGEPTFLRGTGDFASCPETGCPDTDRARWRRKLKALRDYGYNYVRCQSYVYPPEYFDAADEVGMLVQSEMGMLGAWGGHSAWHVYPWPQPTRDNYPILKKQWDEIVRRDLHHPSANLYCMSNELSHEGNQTHFPRIAWQCYHDTRAIKPSAMVLWTDGGMNLELPSDLVNDDAVKDESCPKPLVQHEYRWWSSLPDVRIASRYGGAVRPYAAEITRQAAARWGLESLLADAAAASQRLQFIEAKGQMERCRRDHPRLAGICHFNAMDAHPSPQGILDEFYERKYATPQQWLQTHGDTVVLSSLGFDDRVRIGGEPLRCRFFVSDYSHPPMRTPVFEWRFCIGEEVVASEEFTYAHQPFVTCPVQEVEMEIPAVPHASVGRLHAGIREGNRTFTNQWNLWILPREEGLPDSLAAYGAPRYSWLKEWVKPRRIPAGELHGDCSCLCLLSEVMDGDLARFMRGGGRVLLAATEGLVRPHRPNFGYIRYFFTPPANYPPYEDGQSGTLIREHPMLGGLPHEGFADLQFFRLIDDAPPLDLSPLGLHPGEPVIRVIHRYPVFRPLAYLVERRWGGGGLILCALDLRPGIPEARFLLERMVRYASSDSFNPGEALSAESLECLIEATSLLGDVGS
ncbi:MAG: hypothetical protein HYU36_24695 [Planctomycetes bacterium]|nr:hypothetical protein [Planctomycetota bacterium]